LIKLKAIKVTSDYDHPFGIKMNPFLCEILLENLIVNSVKHNVPAGTITIRLHGKSLRISNSGESTHVAPDQLFQRFAKSNSRSQSLGLGLSIVRAVCETYQFPFSYSINNGVHTFSILFESQTVKE
jgi:signal transduction histidine kinase